MVYFKKAIYIAVIVLLGFTVGCKQSPADKSPVQSQREVISLAGQWSFRLDRQDAGEEEKWYASDLPDTITLPGSTVENGYGNIVSVNTKWTGNIVNRSWFSEEKYSRYRRGGAVKVPFWLTPVKHYVGAAWYQKEIIVPDGWSGKWVSLFLERCHWETKVWLDAKLIGMQDSLSTGHEFDLGVLAAGKHVLTIRVDNTVKIDVGINAHSVSDHTQTNWNGIIGKIELQGAGQVRIEDVQIYPDIEGKTVKVRVTIANEKGVGADGTLEVSAKTSYSEAKREVSPKKVAFTASAGQSVVEIEYPMGEDVLLWDEFSPSLYRLTVWVRGKDFADRESVDFGMRRFGTEGTQFTINGRKTFLRGTLECSIFPLTGYPSTDVDEWMGIIKTAKAHGLNHIRFHSWCPPEAAFVAADRLGFYFQVEGPFWTSIGDGKAVDEYVYSECDRILKTYGNHPSFCMLAYGNEPGGNNQKEFLGKLVNHWKGKDGRRLYTSASGWPSIPENHFHSSYGPRIQHWGAGLKSRINAKAPETITDYSDDVDKYKVPIVSHEIGQWCVYPNFKEIEKYSGVTRAYNFEIFRDGLKENHMLDQADDFLLASGKLQTLCYKEDIESALRTDGFGGFQLLDLHDFPGQGTALVGVLDPFWESKGYVTAEEYHRFSCQTVPLARMAKRIWTNDEAFIADIEIAHFGPADMEEATAIWTVAESGGGQVESGVFAGQTIAVGNVNRMGNIKVPLGDIKSAAKLILTVSIKGTDFSNDWDFWVYPQSVDTAAGEDILLAEYLDDEALAVLKNGGKVMLIPGSANIQSNVQLGFSSIFWNTAWTNNQPPHTLGILCDPGHPALADFPTEYHSNWQWWEIITNSSAMILDDFSPQLRPLVQVIDDWVTNRRLGLVFEAEVNGGKLLVCSIDLKNNLDKRPVARQFRHSLLKYMASADFAPVNPVNIEQLKTLFKGNRSGH